MFAHLTVHGHFCTSGEPRAGQGPIDTSTGIVSNDVPHGDHSIANVLWESTPPFLDAFKTMVRDTEYRFYSGI
jgi:hypothetical protein